MIWLAFGIILAVDGVASLIKFKGQCLFFQSIRLSRVAMGIALIVRELWMV